MSERTANAAVLAFIALGAVLRWIPLGGDLWLDEIWTWDIARGLDSWTDVFTAIHHSNNHHLNTLVFRLLGEDWQPWWGYRIPAFLAGSAAVSVGALIARERGRTASVLAAGLLATNFALIHFSSEARGYAFMLFFCLAAHWALERHLESGRNWTALVFGVCVSLGILSQLFSVFYLAGAMAQSAWVVGRRGGAPARRVVALLRLHALPLAVLALLWWVDLRELRVEGGNPPALYWTLARLFGYGFGLPVMRGLAVPWALAFAVALAFGLRPLRRAGDPLWIAVAVTTVAAPALTLLLLRPDVVAVRYFLVPIAFCLLLLSVAAAPVLERAGPARVAVVAALAALTAGNAFHTARFFEYGRGGYHQALAWMVSHTEGDRIVVGSDHDFRNGLVLHFYARGLPPGRTLDYRPRNAWPEGGTEWFVTHRPDRPEHTPEELVLPGGARYRLEADFDHASLSGFYWALYHRVPGEPGASRSRTTTPNPRPRKGSAPRRTTGR